MAQVADNNHQEQVNVEHEAPDPNIQQQPEVEAANPPAPTWHFFNWSDGTWSDLGAHQNLFQNMQIEVQPSNLMHQD